ncbi:MAG TPA: hypothetical protein VJG32_20300 [Anaerolineae bacterium]|nr:hypothetical protein [Anaerolineae bacterium]
MIALDSVVGELHIVNGRRQSITPSTGAFTAPRRGARGRQEDTLFILIDADGSSSSSIPELIQHIHQTYWHTPGSVTAGVRTAIETGNNWLVDHNRTAAGSTRAGVTCAVLRGSEVFIAQAGPSCAYVAHQGRLERFPRGDVAGSSLPPLGVARAVEVRYSRADLQPGDMLLLVDADFPARMPEEAIASAIVYVGVETALNNLEHLAGSDSFHALVVELAAAAPLEASVQAALPPAPSRSAAREPPAPERAPSRAPGAAAPRPAPAVGEWAGALGKGVARSAGSLGAAFGALFQRTLPDRPVSRQTRRRGPAALERHTSLMTAIAIGIPLIVALVVTAMYLDRSTTAQVATFLDDARQLIADADREPTLDAKRERWQAALTKANAALALAPDDPLALELRTQTQAQLDRLDGTQRVSPVLLYDFEQAGSHRLVAQGVSLFVLDQAEGRIDRLTLNSRGDGIEGGEPALAAAKGITVDDRVVGDLIDIAWVDAGGQRQKSALIVLERGGLIEYDLAFGPAAVRFAEAPVRTGARRLDTFEGNLYILDVIERQIWKYLAAADGYTALPEVYFQTPPSGIETAIDLAIDGNVYILLTNGTVYKYRGGSEAPFSVSGLPEPLGRPVAVSVDPYTPTDSGVYIADVAGARIVHFTADGQFVRQVRAVGGEFAALEDLLVDERAGRLYVISGGRLYSAALPPAIPR